MSDTIVRCGECQAWDRVTFSMALRNGWPEHCGSTMRLESYPSSKGIARATKKAIAFQLRYQEA